MTRSLLREYIWQKAAEDIKSYVDSCLHCLRRKVGNTITTDPQLLVYPMIYRPFDRCHMDLIGPLPTTKKSAKYILVFKCALTKWVELFALRSRRMEDIAECFVDEIVMRHGAPRILVPDGGTEFINRALLSICRLLKTRKVTTSPYNP